MMKQTRFRIGGAVGGDGEAPRLSHLDNSPAQPQLDIRDPSGNTGKLQVGCLSDLEGKVSHKC